MTEQDRQRWDRRFAERTGSLDAPSPQVVAAVGDLATGRLLEVACGDGANAIWLARQGFDVTGVDISAVGLARLERLAEQAGVKVRTVVADLDEPGVLDGLGTFHSIVIARYKPPRRLWREMTAVLEPGGRLLLATFNERHKHAAGRGWRWCLAPGELRAPDPGLRLLRYDEGVGDGGVTDVYLFEKIGGDER